MIKYEYFLKYFHDLKIKIIVVKKYFFNYLIIKN
ncbi:hypothetical protein CWU_03540 [Buchnera aphidicola str. JF98 (Acyrthosiphon pisum)]|nr:hypothetical protein CWU_03540 [Buchnera aphidicola str. JF98 (Acyrthosiphon pisum)]